MTATARRAYPGKVAIRHAVAAAKSCGIDVGGERSKSAKGTSAGDDDNEAR